MNKIFIIGNLTADPDYSVSASGTPVCRFTVAVNRRHASAQGDDRTADFFRVTTFRKTAENCSSYLSKGRKVSVVGALQINEYTDKDGNRRTSVDVTADEVEFLSPRGEDAASAPAPTPRRSGGGNTLEQVNDESLPF